MLPTSGWRWGVCSPSSPRAQAAGAALRPGSRPRPAQRGWGRRHCAGPGNDTAGRPCSLLGCQDQGPGRSASRRPDAGEAGRWRPRPAGSTAGPQTPDLESAGEELLQGRGPLRVRRPSNGFRGTQGVRVVVARLPQRPSPGRQAWGRWWGGLWVRVPWPAQSTREDVSEALQVAMPHLTPHWTAQETARGVAFCHCKLTLHAWSLPSVVSDPL